MPAQDRTGPQGLGPMTGRGLGWCSGASPRERVFTRGFGRGMGRGFGKGFALSCQGQCPICPACPYINQSQKQPSKKEQKQFLQEELKTLEEEKSIIEKELKKIE